MDVSQTLGWGPDAVAGLLGRGLSTTVAWSQLTTLATLGLEELALPRGHGNEVAVISTRAAPGPVFLVAGLPTRRTATGQAFLASMPAPLKATIPTVGPDRDDGYPNAVEAARPGVTVVGDRFPVAQGYPARVDPRRQQELKRLQQERPEAESEPLQGLRGVVRHDWTGRSEADQHRWRPRFHHSPALKQADGRRQGLTGSVNSPFPQARARDAIEGWGEPGRASGRRCFDGFLTTVANWKEAITNDFLQRQNSGFVEGLKNQLNVLKRRC